MRTHRWSWQTRCAGVQLPSCQSAVTEPRVETSSSVWEKSNTLTINLCLCDVIVVILWTLPLKGKVGHVLFALQDVSHGLSSGPITSHIHSAPDHGMMSEGVVAVGPYTGTGHHLSVRYQNTCFWFLSLFSLLVNINVQNNQMQLFSLKEFFSWNVDEFVFLHMETKGFTLHLLHKTLF